MYLVSELWYFIRRRGKPLQKLQMATQEGENVFVAAIQGNFDDAQSGVKKLFCDPQIATGASKTKPCVFQRQFH